MTRTLWRRKYWPTSQIGNARKNTRNAIRRNAPRHLIGLSIAERNIQTDVLPESITSAKS